MYEATLSNGDSIPPFISFNSFSKEFNIYTTDNSNAGSYTIQIRAYVTNSDETEVDNTSVEW